MSDGIIKLNEEIDQVVEDLDGVVGSYKKRVDELAGSQEGVAVHFHRAMSRVELQPKSNSKKLMQSSSRSPKR